MWIFEPSKFDDFQLLYFCILTKSWFLVAKIQITLINYQNHFQLFYSKKTSSTQFWIFPNIEYLDIKGRFFTMCISISKFAPCLQSAQLQQLWYWSDYCSHCNRKASVVITLLALRTREVRRDGSFTCLRTSLLTACKRQSK